MKTWSLLAVLAVSAAWGASAVVGQGSARPHVVFLSGEDEYQTETTLPAFARSDLEPKGLRVSIIHASMDDPDDFPGMARALADADLVVVSVRRRTPPRDQIEALRAYLDAGKPLVGIRTACHAFALRAKDTPKPGHTCSFRSRSSRTRSLSTSTSGAGYGSSSTASIPGRRVSSS